VRFPLEKFVFLTNSEFSSSKVHIKKLEGTRTFGHRIYNPIFLEKFFRNAFLTGYCGWILTVRCWSTHVWRQIGDKATNLKDSDFLRKVNLFRQLPLRDTAIL
jgi:hypothetical protein